MKYELGNIVNINKHWKRINVDVQIEAMGITNLEEYLMSDDMAGDYIHLDKYVKVPIQESGYICGIREYKTSYDLMFITDEPYVEDIVRQIDYKTEKVYLVATRMNSLRKVSSEDITFVGD